MAGKNLSAFLTVDLAMNTQKFQRSIKGASGTTKTLLTALNKVTVTAKKTGEALLSIGKTLTGLATGTALAGLYALTRGASDSVNVFEDMRAKLSAVTGDLKTAEAVFWELNTLEDETTKSTQELSDALLYLNKFGINATSKDLKNLSAVSLGLNKDLATITSAIGKASQGRYKALQELGIQVDDTGNKLKLTFQGVSSEVDKSADAVKNYLSSLGETRFAEVLTAKLNTTESALNRFKNAWGTLQTEIFRSDGAFGQLFQSILNTGTNMVNGLIEIFRLESVKKALENGIREIQEGFKSLYTFITGKTVEFDTTWSEIWLGIVNFAREKIAQFKVIATSFINAFKLIGAAIYDYLITPLIRVGQAGKKSFDELKKTLSDIGSGNLKEGLHNILKKASLPGLMYDMFSKTKEVVEEEGSVLSDTLTETLTENGNVLEQATQDYMDTIKSIEESENELKEKLKSQGNKESIIDTLFSGFGSSGSSGVSKALSSGKSLIDTLSREWSAFYKSLISESRNSLSERQRLEIEFNEKNVELAKYTSVASETEIANARNLIFEQFQKRKQELELEAKKEFLTIMGEETELLQLDTEKRIEIIRQMYEDELLTASEFMQAQSKLIDEYYKKAGSQKKNKDHLLSEENVKRVNDLKDATQSLSDSFSDMAGAMSKGSSSYKALFAIQKGFAVASATMNAILAWSQALADTTAVSWYQKLANYANAIALTANIISQLKSVQMYDKGGTIKSGEVGIVGEYGPELIQGPVNVTGRKETSELLTKNSTITVNLYENSEKSGVVESSETEEGTIIDIFVSNIRRGGDMASAIESTYNLKRIGV